MQKLATYAVSLFATLLLCAAKPRTAQARKGTAATAKTRQVATNQGGSKRSTVHSSALKTSSGKRASAHGSYLRASRHSSTRFRQTHVPAREVRGQQAPTADRYREIEQALSDRGYYKGEVSGAWGPESVDALKRFQTDQNMEADGKLGSLSLIALGLGPKRALSAQSNAPSSHEVLPVAEPASMPATEPGAPNSTPPSVPATPKLMAPHKDLR